MNILLISAFITGASLAADSISRTLSLDEVEVVSSIKESTLMRQQPTAVSIVSEKQIIDNHIGSLKGVSALVPNFFMPDYGSRLTSAIYIRGVGSRMNTPAVGMYMDNIPYTDKSAFDFRFHDIERVDVMRGPQGTLYGRNAMGGILRIYTKNPFTNTGTEWKRQYTTGDNHGYISLSHRQRLNDKFAFSASGYYETGSGFFRNDFTGEKVDRVKAGGGKIRTIYKSGTNTTFDFNVGYDYSDEGAYPYYYVGSITDPSYEAGSIGKICNNHRSKYRRGMLNVGLNIERRMQSLVMNAVTGYQNLNDRMFLDQDFISKDIYTLEQKQRINTFTEELTLKNTKKDSWEWVSGISFMYQSLNTKGPVTFYSDGMQWLEGNINRMMPDVTTITSLSKMGFSNMAVNFRSNELGMGGTFDTPSTNIALFHQSTLHLTPKLSATLGLRVDYENTRMTYLAPATVDYGFIMANSKSPMMNVNLQNLSSEMLYDGKMSKDYFYLLPKAALKYDLGNGCNIYGSASMGKRSGGYNVQMFSDLLQGTMKNAMMLGIQKGLEDYLLTLGMPQPAVVSVTNTMKENMPVGENPTVEQVVYKPEYSWNFEVGTHMNIADKALQLDAALFLINTYDQQIARFAPSGLGRMMVNAGKSRSLGAELTALWQPDSHWAFSANYGFTKAKFTHYDAGDGNDYTKNYVPFVPRHTVNVDAAYTWHINKDGWMKSLTLAANYRGAGDIYWTEANNAKQSYYSLLGTRIVMEFKRHTLALWTANTTNTHYNSFYFESAGRGFEQHGKPFQFGIDWNARL